MTLCTDMTLVGYGEQVKVAQPLRCRSWSCEHCHPMRRRMLIRQCLGGKPDTFITLTSNPAQGGTPTTRAKALSDAWRKLKRLAEKENRRNGYKRAMPYGIEDGDGYSWDGRGFIPRQVLLHGDKLPFIAVFEATKTGEPHLHILARSRWIGQRYLSQIMSKLTGSWVVNIQRLRQKKKAARYAAKYCGKNPHRFEGTKRYWESQNYQVEDDHEGPQDENPNMRWEVVRQNFLDFLDQNRHAGSFLGAEGYQAWWLIERGVHPP